MSVRSLKTLSEPTSKYIAILNDNARSVYSLIRAGVEFDYINFLNALADKKLNVAYEIWKQHIRKGGEQWLLPEEFATDILASPQCLFASVCDAKLVQLWVNQNLQAVMDNILTDMPYPFENGGVVNIFTMDPATIHRNMKTYFPLLVEMVNFYNFEGILEMIRLLDLKIPTVAVSKEFEAHVQQYGGDVVGTLTIFSEEVKYGLIIVLIIYGWLDALIEIEKTYNIILNDSNQLDIENIGALLLNTAFDANNILIVDWLRITYPFINDLIESDFRHDYERLQSR